MARGFESKSVADQQESAQEERVRSGPGDGRDPAVATRRRCLELAMVDIRRQLDAAQAEPHKEMLRRALTALEQDLSKLA